MQQSLAALIAPLRLTLNFLISEAASWDPAAAAAEIARGEYLADRDPPDNVEEFRGLLNLMALATMDLLDRIAPVPTDRRGPVIPAPAGPTGHDSPDTREETPDVQPQPPLPSRHGARWGGSQGHHKG